MAKSKLIEHLKVATQSHNGSLVLLLLRLTIGGAFVLHGWGKIQHPFGWMGPDSKIPAIFQFLAALSEFGGGIAWMLGFLTPVASLGIGCTMGVAVYMHMVLWSHPFVASNGGPSYEPALVYFVASLLFLALGSGKYSVDAKIFGERK